jgi:hypothetical protein
MAHVHGKSMMKMSNVKESVGKEIVKGSMASVTVHTGAKLMSKLVKNPIVVFGAGVAAGVLVYKYRKQIIASANKAIDSGKDFVLQQKENLEDLVAEAKEEV